MSAWFDWIYEIALSRVDTIERELYAHPERSPKFSEAVRELHAALDETEEHPNAALTGRDEIWMGYNRRAGAGDVSGRGAGRRTRVPRLCHRRTAGQGDSGTEGRGHL